MEADAVYVAFRLRGSSAVDRLTAVAAGGPHVHCELVVLRDSTLFTYGSVAPNGVYASSVRDSAYFGMFDRFGSRVPREEAQAAGLDWDWVDITALVGTSGTLEAWARRRLGTPYRTAIYADLLLPVTFGTAKQSVICSEFAADAIIATSGARAPQVRSAVRQHAAWGVGCLKIQQSSAKLTPQGLWLVLQEMGARELTVAERNGVVYRRGPLPRPREVTV